LERERAEFFETRVTGRPEIWAALKNVSELLREGELATAQGILEAAGVTTPTGNLIEGCYDEAGNLYRLPQTLILDPTNVIPDETMKQPNRNSNIDGETMVGLSEAKSAALDSGQAEDTEKEEEDRGATERRREEKGKASERDAVKVKCRLSDRGGPDVVVLLGRSQTVGALARRIKSETDASRFTKMWQVWMLIPKSRSPKLRRFAWRISERCWMRRKRLLHRAGRKGTLSMPLLLAAARKIITKIHIILYEMYD
jgi:hypothetical protein